MGTAGTDVNDALLKLESLSEEDLSKLASNLGITDDDVEDEGDGGTPADGTTDVDGTQPKPKTEDTTPSPKLTGQDLLKEFQSNPEAQQLVKTQLDTWLAEASARADAEHQSQEFQKLVETGDFEEIGRRYVTAESEKAIRTKAEEEALTRAYGDVYSRLFKELESFPLSPEEKQHIAPEQYTTDAEYVLALSSFIAEKKSGVDFDQRVDAKVEETLTTLRNMKAGVVAGAPSVSTLPGGTPSTDSNRPQTSRNLIQDGFHEILEEAAGRRVGQE